MNSTNEITYKRYEWLNEIKNLDSLINYDRFFINEDGEKIYHGSIVRVELRLLSHTEYIETLIDVPEEGSNGNPIICHLLGRDGSNASMLKKELGLKSSYFFQVKFNNELNDKMYTEHVISVKPLKSTGKVINNYNLY